MPQGDRRTRRALPFWFGSVRNSRRTGLGADEADWQRVERDVDRLPSWRSVLRHHRVAIGGSVVVAAAIYVLLVGPTWFSGTKTFWFVNLCGDDLYLATQEPDLPGVASAVWFMPALDPPGWQYTEMGPSATLDVLWVATEAGDWTGPHDLSPVSVRDEDGLWIRLEGDLCPR